MKRTFVHRPTVITVYEFTGDPTEITDVLENINDKKCLTNGNPQKEISMNKAERSAIEEAISLLEYTIKHGEKSLWYENVITTCESDLQETLKILKGIIKAKGDKHERT